ncbi:uncharacterized protein IL334_005010 [Kwoniella shivajii]|uniref:WD40 repeat-like protein n=1 Tax=Kwoniella shivajii TaxID=564305 RepID=A0ABZ1D1Y7_9TREE|nr:hypothetical protein IL334_005010 [Kwoniella shivajii]
MSSSPTPETNPFQISSSSSSASASPITSTTEDTGPGQSHLRSKIGQPSSSTPRTEASNRRRFGGLFASFGIPGSVSGNGTGSGPPSRPQPRTPLRRIHGQTQEYEDYGVRGGEGGGGGGGGEGNTGVHGGVWSFAERMKELTIGSPKGTSKSIEKRVADNDKIKLEDLPDELILLIILQLPPTLSQLDIISRISTRFYDLTRTPIIWLEIFHAYGFELIDRAKKDGVAVEYPPQGHWRGDHWITDPPLSSSSSSSTSTYSSPSSPSYSSQTMATSSSPSSSTSTSPVIQSTDQDEPCSNIHSVPIHYPTLMRSRLILQNQIHSEEYIPTVTKLAENKSHKDVIYCLNRFNDYLLTGSRDRSIHIYKLPPPSGFDPNDDDTDKGINNRYGSGSDRNKSRNEDSPIWIEEDAHQRSVLTLDSDLDENGKGLLVSGSSDMSIGIWSVDLSVLDEPISTKGVHQPRTHSSNNVIKKLKVIQTDSTILSIIISPEYIISSSKDHLINVYSRSTYGLIKSLQGHTQPVNSIALSPNKQKLVSASSDGFWKIWNLDSGVVEKQGGGGRGVACVLWAGDHILTGDNDNLVRLYDSSSVELLKTFNGHTDLVRSVSMGKSLGIVVSASYDRTIRMWDLNTGKLIKIANEDRSSLIFDLSIQSNRIIAATQDHSVHILSFGDDLPYTHLFE